MRNRAFIPAIVAAMGALALFAQSERLLKFTTIAVRGSSEVQEPSAKVIRTEAQWKEFAGSQAPATPIDFGKETVVALFAGQKMTGGYTIRVQKITDDSKAGQPSRATVHYQVNGPPAGTMVTQALTYPSIVVRIAGRPEVVDFNPPFANAR